MSGIYIPGMEMPRRCIACPIGFFDNEYDILHCPLTGEEFHSTDFVYKRSENCPLVPVPEHGRLIDADALIIALETQDYSGAPDTLEEWTPMGMTEVEIGDIRNAPTIIPEDKEGE